MPACLKALLSVNLLAGMCLANASTHYVVRSDDITPDFLYPLAAMIPLAQSRKKPFRDCCLYLVARRSWMGIVPDVHVRAR